MPRHCRCVLRYWFRYVGQNMLCFFLRLPNYQCLTVPQRKSGHIVTWGHWMSWQSSARNSILLLLKDKCSSLTLNTVSPAAYRKSFYVVPHEVVWGGHIVVATDHKMWTFTTARSSSTHVHHRTVNILHLTMNQVFASKLTCVMLDVCPQQSWKTD